MRSVADAVRSETALFRRLFTYTRPYRGRLILSWVATGGYAAAGAGLVYLIKPIFDKALIAGVDVGRLSLTILVLYAIKGFSSYFSTTLVADAGQHAVTDLRNALYQHVLGQSFAFLGRSSTGTLMSHITTDVEKIQAAVSELAGDLLKEGLTIVGLLAVLFYMDWRLAILSLVGMPLALHPLVRFGRRLRASNETSLRRWRDISEILQETISGFRVVKAFRMEKFEIRRFRRASSRLLNVNMGITRTTAILPPLMEGVGGVAMVGALLYGSFAIRSGYLTTGAFVSFLTALFAMYTPIKRLSRVNATLQAALAAGSRVFEVLDRHDEVPEAEKAVPLPRMKGEIEYRSVGFRYSDGHGTILRNVSFVARPGEVVAIVGTSGAGKTTMLKLIYCYERPDRGKVFVDEVEVSTLKQKNIPQLRRNIGIVFQDFRLFSDKTVYDNVAVALQFNGMHPQKTRGYVNEILEKVGLLKAAKYLPQYLSGGEQQRIVIARAMVSKPKVILADEPTGNLDEANAESVMRLLNEISDKGTTVLIATHNKDIYQGSGHRVLHLDNSIIERDYTG